MKRYSSRPFWFYRIYSITVALTWNAVLIPKMIGGSKKLGSEILYLIPFLIPAIFLILSAAVFKFPYSAFGSLKRSQPSYDAIENASMVGGEIGHLRATAPFISWSVYTEGIGFSVIGIGSGFVPFSFVRNVDKRMFGGCTVEHTSPEVRSPLLIPSSRISAAIENLYKLQNTN